MEKITKTIDTIEKLKEHMTDGEYLNIYETTKIVYEQQEVEKTREEKREENRKAWLESPPKNVVEALASIFGMGRLAQENLIEDVSD
jgi:hypothetical protein